MNSACLAPPSMDIEYVRIMENFLMLDCEAIMNIISGKKLNY